jgi:hypothetical protein
LAALTAAERAWDTLTGALELPPPDGGLDGVWRVYLVDAVDGGGAAVVEARDPVARFDRGESFGVVQRTTRPGCALDTALARAVAQGSLLRVAPATDTGAALAQSEAFARWASLSVGCAAGDEDRAAFQARPDRVLVDTAPGAAFNRGASLFFEWLDARLAVEPGALVRGLWALAPTRTPADAARWAASPTTFDVLRVSLADALWPGSTFDDALVRFAVERWQVPGPKPRLAWRVPWSTLGAPGRRLASPEPPAPTGASYVLVDGTSGTGGGSAAAGKLRVEAQWEDYARMRWVVVKLDAAGRAVGEMPVTAEDRATRASLTVESLDGAAAVLVVGANVGSTEHPFDPNQGEWEPHGWLLTLEAE